MNVTPTTSLHKSWSRVVVIYDNPLSHKRWNLKLREIKEEGRRRKMRRGMCDDKCVDRKFNNYCVYLARKSHYIMICVKAQIPYNALHKKATKCRAWERQWFMWHVENCYYKFPPSTKCRLCIVARLKMKILYFYQQLTLQISIKFF